MSNTMFKGPFKSRAAALRALNNYEVTLPTRNYEPCGTMLVRPRGWSTQLATMHPDRDDEASQQDLLGFVRAIRFLTERKAPPIKTKRKRKPARKR